MTVHILMGGTSILDNVKSGRGKGETGRSVQEEIVAFLDWAEVSKIHERKAVDWAGDAKDHLDAIAPICNYDRIDVSAELATMMKVGRTFLDKESLWKDWPEPTDEVVIIASQTSDGVVAAMANCRALKRSIQFHDEPTDSATEQGTRIWTGEGTPAHIVKVPGLVPRRTHTFVDSMLGVGTALRWAARRGGAPVLHLTAGFKATIPYVTVLAEYRKVRHGDLKAFCLHEGPRAHSEGTGNEPELSPEPVEIYLRTPHLEDDRQELTDVDRLVQGSSVPNGTQGRKPPATEALLNFAYWIDDKGNYQLNSLGRILNQYLDLGYER